MEEINNENFSDLKKMMHNDSTTSNNELDIFGKKLYGNKYIGTYPADTFVNKIYPEMKDGNISVVNIDNHNQSGEHWVSFMKIGNKLYGYDSYGKNIKKYNPVFKKLKIIQDTNDGEQTLSFSDKSCGQHALIIWKIMENFGPKNFLMV